MSNFNTEVCELNLEEVREDFAANNGWGFVYHKSNCKWPNTRQYLLGGRLPGSDCGEWTAIYPNINYHPATLVHDCGDNHNWSVDELAAGTVTGCSAAGL